jgi:CheY-like chemotaxis protein
MPEFGSLPIVFLTAKAMPEDKDKSIAAGATDYVTKPVDLDRLLDVMASWLNTGHDRVRSGRTSSSRNISSSRTTSEGSTG